MILKDICFIRQYYESILLYVNSYKNGYNILRYRIKGDNEYINININSPTIIIDDITKEGYYEFQVINSTNKLYSDVYTIYFLHENIEDNCSKIIKNMPKELQDNNTITLLKKDIHKIYIKDNNIKNNISYICYNKYINTENIQPEEENVYYTFLMTSQQYYNNQSIFWNKNISEDFNIDYSGSGKIITNGLIDKIIILDKNKKLYKSIKCEGFLDIDLLINKSGYYIIKLYAQDNLINILTFIQFNDLLKTKTWQHKKDQDSFQSIINSNQYNNITYSSVELTNDEIKYLNQENAKNPTFPFINQVEVLDNGNNVVSILIHNYDLLHTLNNNFYIAIKENDTLFTDFFNDYTIINNSIIKINLAKKFFYDQMLFFIKDQNGNMVSPITRFSYDNDFSSYYRKVYIIKINSYLKRLIPLISKRIPESLEFIQNITDIAIKNNDDNDWIYYWKYLIEMILIHGKSINKNNTIKVILEDLYNNYPSKNDFYNKPIVMYRSTDMIIFPESNNSNYVLIVNKITKDNHIFDTEYISSSNSSIDYSIKEKGRYIFYALNSNTYEMSGIIYINNLNGEECMFDCETKVEVL